MKAGFANDEYTHIGSFRRQLYIHPDDLDKMPDSILINFEQTKYRIFLNDDTVTWYLCKQTGHTSNHCKKEIENKIKTIHCNNLNYITDINDTDNNIQQDLNTNSIYINSESNFDNDSSQSTINLSSAQEPTYSSKSVLIVYDEERSYRSVFYSL